MSTTAEDTPDPEGWPSLRDVFHKEVTENGGDTARAFIEVLDELDSRTGASDEHIGRNTEWFEALVTWLKATDIRVRKIPGQIEAETAKGASRLSDTAEAAADKGARRGAAPSQAAMEALREAVDAYQDRRDRITWLAALGLPVAFVTTLGAALLFASFVLPTLPRHWEWPCRILGAEFRPNIDPDSPISFCVYVRE